MFSTWPSTSVAAARASAKWVGVELSAENHGNCGFRRGFAHGFLVLSESADFLYKTTDYYAPRAERSLHWDDPALSIPWPEAGMPPLLSDKDLAAPMLCDADSFD